MRVFGSLVDIEGGRTTLGSVHASWVEMAALEGRSGLDDAPIATRRDFVGPRPGQSRRVIYISFVETQQCVLIVRHSNSWSPRESMYLETTQYRDSAIKVHRMPKPRHEIFGLSPRPFPRLTPLLAKESQ